MGKQREHWDFKGINNAFYTADDQSIVVYGPWTIILLDAASGQETMRVTTSDAPMGASRVLSTPDGRYIVTVDGLVKFWNTQTGKEERQIAGDEPIYAVAFSPDGLRIATTELPQIVKVWDAQTGSVLWSVKSNTTVTTWFSPDSQWLLTTSDNMATLWETTTGKEVVRLEHDIKGSPRWIGLMAFSPNGRLLATGSSDNLVRVWDTTTGKKLLQLGEYTRWISTVAFSSDGRTLLTAALDGAARIWDVSDLVTGSPSAVQAGRAIINGER